MFTNTSHLAVLLVLGVTVAEITDKLPCLLDISVGAGDLNFYSLACVTSVFCCCFIYFFTLNNLSGFQELFYAIFFII